MWPKNYKDYPLDTPLIQDQVEPSHGIIGCEMHELNGWGNSLHVSLKTLPQVPTERELAEGDRFDTR